MPSQDNIQNIKKTRANTLMLTTLLLTLRKQLLINKKGKQFVDYYTFENKQI